MTTSLQKDALLARFSVLAYQERSFLAIASNLPPGWTLKDDRISPPFAAFAFKNESTGEVVVAFRGTDGLKDGAANLAILSGTWDSQFKQGMEFVAAVKNNSDILPDSSNTSQLLVTGHSLGGAIAQVTGRAFGLDGSAIDPGAASSIAQTAGFSEAALAAGLPSGGVGMPSAFTNYLVAGSLVSGGSGVHLGQTSYLPSVTFSGQQTLQAFLIGAVNPLAGIAYAIGIDQVGNKHSSLQVQQALGLLAGTQPDTASPTTLALHPKEVGTAIDPMTGLSKPVYSQTEFEIRDAAGLLLSSARFSGAGATRTLEVFDAGGALQSTTTVASTGVVTVRPVNAPSVTVSYPLDALPAQDKTITTTTKDSQSNVLSSNNKQFDDFDNLLGEFTDTPDGQGGITRTIDVTVDGQPVQLTQYASAASLINGEQPGDYVTNAIEINGQSAVNADLIANVIDETYKSAKDIILARGTGEFTHIIEAGDATNANGTTASLVAATGRPDWWNDPAVISLASSTTSLISLLRGGTPLAIATNGVNFASHVFADPAVAQIAFALGGVSSVAGLVTALKKGDLGRILIDGGGVARSTLTIYSNSLQQEMISRFGSAFHAGELAGNGNVAAAELYNSSLGVDQMLKGLGQAIAVLNIINSLANGDIKGAVISAITLAFPVAGAILTAIDFVAGLIFERKRDFEADGRFVVGADGVITAQIGEVNGGGQHGFYPWMNAMLEQTQKQALRIGEINGQPMGVIAERLPVVTFKRDAMFLRYEDPLTKTVYYKTFDFDGKYLSPGSVEDVLNAGQTSIFRSPWGDSPDNPFVNRGADPRDWLTSNQVALSDSFFDSFAQHYSDAVTASGAIAPLWEVETVKQQRASGYQNAGWTTDQVAYQSGHHHSSWYGAPGDAQPGNLDYRNEFSQQTATVIALDLNRDGVITTTKKATGNGVLFDVDNDGFAEETDWIGPRDGILVLDRTSSGQAADGQINRGADLFNDTWVDGKDRRLTVLNEINNAGNASNGSTINTQDPVFSHLKVWMDINGDGVAQRAEMQSLQSLGINSLQWDWFNGSEVGTFTQNGQTRLMQSVNLQANAAGVASVQVGNSLLVEKEVGGQDLYATAVINYGASTDAAVRAGHTHTSSGGGLVAIDEVLDGQEDTAITVSVAQLLKNDRSSTGTVSLVGLTNGATHGNAAYDAAKQTITFMPTANFNGVASFGYAVTDAQGQQVQATAFVDVGAVDDAPTITVTSARRQAGWRDLVITSNAQGNSVYAMAPTIFSSRGQQPASPVTQVTPLGYLGDTATSLQPDSVGIIGFAEGKLYYAAFAQQGNAATQMDWWEVWVDPVEGASSGIITVSDVDGPGQVRIGVDGRVKDRPQDGQFGDTKVVDNQNGTASFHYTRTSLWSQPASSYLTGGNESSDGIPVYVPIKAGPDDAFVVEVKQPGGADGQTIDSYEKVIVSAPGASEARSEYEYLQLIDGSFLPPANLEPFNAFPIVLDLNDNGFRFIGVQDSSAFYDLAGDGVRRATAWTSGQDALLAYDANNDGKISGKAEITFKDYLPGAATDLAGLVAFDTNADGVFSSADAEWGKFRVWQDKNEDGIQTADELSKLTERGIASINLTSNNVASSASGVTVHGVGSYTRIDGTQAQLADAQFAYTSETLSSVSNDTVDLSVNPVAQLSTGGGDDAITGSAGADRINAGTGNDVVRAGGGNDVVIGGAGNDQISGGEGADTLWGGKGSDKLSGDAGNDLLYGGSGDDYLSGGDGDDHFWGGTGNDVTSGGTGLDAYHFSLGDGNDLIRDIGTDGLRIVLGTNLRGQSINPQNIQAEALEGGRGYILRFSANDSLTVQNLGNAPLAQSSVQITLADGSSVSMAQLIAATHINHAPTLTAAVADQAASQGRVWTFTVPAGTFGDLDAGDTLSLEAKLDTGEPLPFWLNFSAATRSFTGTPPAAGLGNLEILVTATDAFGLTATADFLLTVEAAVNRAPTVLNALTQKTVNEDGLWTFAVPTTTFVDSDAGDTLTLSASLANGDPLPAWLSFNATTRTFSGTPLNANVGPLGIKVVATDGPGVSTSSSFEVQVNNANDAPTVNGSLTAQNATGGQAFSYAVPMTGASAAFVDQDVGDVLTLSAKLVNGDALPSWLSFNAATGTFSGTPPGSAVGSLSLQVIATDLSGVSTSSAFTLAVQAGAGTGGTTPPLGALVGTPGNDVLTANSTYTEVWGLGGNDIINGFWGSTKLVGGAGNDTINAVGGAANVLDGGEGNDILTGAWGNDTLIGGEGNNILKATGGAATVTAGSGNDIITGSWGDDKIAAGSGNNEINAGGGNNNVFAGAGNDKIAADSGNDTVNAGDGNNTIGAGEGRNVIVSGEGNDTIAALGTNVVIAGAGNDKFTLGWGNDWIQGGKGNDVIDAGGGANLFAFNKGDGSDTIVNSVWGADTISLGGGVKYADLKLTKSGDDLILKGTGSDKITLKDWYKADQNRGVGRLQVLTAGGDFDAVSTNTLVNKTVTVFDFDKLVKAFDVARTANPSVASGWAVSSSLSAAQLHATAPIATGYVNPWAALQAGTALLEKAPTAAINPINTSTAQSVDQLLFAALNATGNSDRAAGWMQA